MRRSRLQEADNVGVGGWRGLSVTAVMDSGLTYDAGPGISLSTPGTSLAASVSWHRTATITTTPTEARVLEVNFISVNTASVTGTHVGAGGKVQMFNGGGNTSTSDDVEIEFRRSNADVATAVSTPGFDIQPGRWYKVTFTMTSQGLGQTIPSTLVLDDYGLTGTSLVAGNVYSHSFNIPAEDGLTGDSEVFSRSVRNGSPLLDAMDNFEFLDVTPIPEPTAMAGLMLGSVALLARKRRRLQQHTGPSAQKPRIHSIRPRDSLPPRANRHSGATRWRSMTKAGATTVRR